jgi:hypothetical protein
MSRCHWLVASVPLVTPRVALGPEPVAPPLVELRVGSRHAAGLPVVRPAGRPAQDNTPAASKNVGHLLALPYPQSPKVRFTTLIAALDRNRLQFKMPADQQRPCTDELTRGIIFR